MGLQDPSTSLEGGSSPPHLYPQTDRSFEWLPLIPSLVCKDLSKILHMLAHALWHQEVGY